MHLEETPNHLLRRAFPAFQIFKRDDVMMISTYLPIWVRVLHLEGRDGHVNQKLPAKGSGEIGIFKKKGVSKWPGSARERTKMAMLAHIEAVWQGLPTELLLFWFLVFGFWFLVFGFWFLVLFYMLR